MWIFHKTLVVFTVLGYDWILFRNVLRLLKYKMLRNKLCNEGGYTLL